MRGNSSPPPGPTRGFFFFPISSADWVFLFTRPPGGLMFYYGLDFHDLAPNFILNISAFIVVCEAFLCIRPHFGLWLQTFCVMPKVVTASKRSAEEPWWARCLMSPGWTTPLRRP